MNNDEMKKKIIETLEKGGRNFLKSKETKVSIYEYYADAIIAAVIGYVKDLQVQVDSLEITNIALQAGYDDAEKDRLYWVDKYKEAEHRAEVAEKALKKYLEKESCRFCNYKKINYCEATKETQEDCFNATIETYIEQAEKELAEERKDDKNI